MYGNLCTNIYETEPALTRVLYAFNDGIFDSTAAAIDSTTLEEDYPDNVYTLTRWMTEEGFNDWTANQIQVDGTDENGDACTECNPFTTYWDFLTAVAKTPGFCGGVAGSMYSRFTDGQMCGKEAAGALATIIAQTNLNNADLTDANGDIVPLYKQGLNELADPDCDVNNGGDTSSAKCQMLGGDPSSYPAYYADKGLDPNGHLFVPRGAGYIYGADQYYWFSKLVYGDSSITDDPTLVQTDAVTWWMSGMLTWMIPMNGKPAPHNIIMGQWEPTEVEAEYNIVDGFGAVSQLLYGGSQCGQANHPVAALRTQIYEGLLADINAADGSWAAADTVHQWEANDCASAALADFPDWGEYSNVPQFAATSVITPDLTEHVAPYTCYVVNHRTDFIVWEKDAFRECIMEGAGAGARR